MPALTERMDAVEHRVDRLESALVQFMAHTEHLFERMEAERASDREESARQREESARQREESARDREESARDREESARHRQALDRSIQEMKREAARERKEMNKRWGELANKMGTVVEDIVAPSIRRLARELFDCGEERYFATRVTVHCSDDPSRQREFDALYVGTRAVLLNETKSSPRSDDAKAFVDFLQRQEFGRYYPQYGKLPIVPAFSSLSLADDLVRFLTRRGIYALAMGDQAMRVLNLSEVRSRRAAGSQP